MRTQHNGLLAFLIPLLIAIAVGATVVNAEEEAVLEPTITIGDRGETYQLSLDWSGPITGKWADYVQPTIEYTRMDVDPMTQLVQFPRIKPRPHQPPDQLVTFTPGTVDDWRVGFTARIPLRQAASVGTGGDIWYPPTYKGSTNSSAVMLVGGNPCCSDLSLVKKGIYAAHLELLEGRPARARQILEAIADDLGMELGE